MYTKDPTSPQAPHASIPVSSPKIPKVEKDELKRKKLRANLFGIRKGHQTPLVAWFNNLE